MKPTRCAALTIALALISGCVRQPPATSSPSRYTARTAEVRGWYLRAAVARRRGDVDEAVRALGWVQRLERSDSPWPQVALGELMERAGRTDEARDAYLQALDRDPELGVAHLALARIAIARDDVALAKEHLQVAAEEAQLNDAYAIWVRLLHREGDPSAVATLHAWVRQIDTSHAAALDQLLSAEQIGCRALPSVDLLWERWDPDEPILTGARRLHARCDPP